MNVIAIESSTERCSVALRCGDDYQQRIGDRPREHTEQILSMMESLLAEAGLRRQQIDQVAFGQGPGSFTGVRVACSVAQGLGYALNIPVLPVSSLAALAQSAIAQLTDTQTDRRVIAVQDARLAEIYLGVYEFDGAGSLTSASEERVIPPNSIADYFDLDGNDWLAAGNGWQVYQTELATILETRVATQLPASWPDALAVLALSRSTTYCDRAVSADQAQPVYLRDQVTHRK